ncbi:hypothetical protein EJ05DRAFT_344504 [Pseudovirgaria hyperparasitica]|uniref:Uncharacterized protein n=1 Tax=Pseudovirgaria hyperparasitica TaxID=470096 RepID=A0A6A6WCT7_9PEZI|nr:uncharacterized protein EJ05DRAFT_344504 [Pseudovirgaria hyperparasitica]KAF2759387.1 hypothetical protein EJ05DRAFT_344504 [Pseudovirgaria hyperparasitica]
MTWMRISLRLHYCQRPGRWLRYINQPDPSELCKGTINLQKNFTFISQRSTNNMCYTAIRWHRCGIHTATKGVHCRDATLNEATGRLNSCGQPGGTYDAGFTHLLCGKPECPHNVLGGCWTCCQCGATENYINPCKNCAHQCCWNCRPIGKSSFAGLNVEASN